MYILTINSTHSPERVARTSSWPRHLWALRWRAGTCSLPWRPLPYSSYTGRRAPGDSGWEGRGLPRSQSDRSHSYSRYSGRDSSEWDTPPACLWEEKKKKTKDYCVYANKTHDLVLLLPQENSRFRIFHNGACDDLYQKIVQNLKN